MGERVGGWADADGGAAGGAAGDVEGDGERLGSGVVGVFERAGGGIRDCHFDC